MSLDPPVTVIRWLNCPACQKRHAAAHSCTYSESAAVTCPCGVRFHAFTGQIVPPPIEETA